MALTTCRECSQPVSSEAVTCPHCGVPDPWFRTPATRPEAPSWKPGDPYPPELIPLVDPSKRGLLGRPRRLGKFHAGQRVYVDSFGRNGEATVLDWSTDFNRSLGTKVYPRWLVEFDSGQREWFNGISLTPTRGGGA